MIISLRSVVKKASRQGVYICHACKLILQNVLAGENRSVAVFVTFNDCVTFNPAVNRIFIEFRDANNNVVGSTSTAVSTGR